MSVPHPGGRVQPRRTFPKTVHAWAAGQSVFGAGTVFLDYPDEAERLRRRWVSRVIQLRALEFHPFACDADYDRAVSCTWGMADAVRAATFYALVANGFGVAAFDDEEFAVVVPNGDTGQMRRLKGRAEESVRGALDGWADNVGKSVTVAVAPVW